MAYTINYFYTKFLGKIDKEGSDFYSLPEVMEALETATNDFIEEVLRYDENVQILKDYLLPLYTPYSLPLVANPSNTKEMLATLPTNYRNLRTAHVPGSRITKIIQKGEYDINEANPNKVATPEYPAVVQYQNYIAVYGPTSGTVQGFYLQKPTYGDMDGNLDNEIAVNLPDESVEKIMLLMTNIIHGKEGDQRYQISFNQEKSYGHSNK